MKTVLITGSTSEIGIAIAKILAKNNINLILHYHTKEDIVNDLKQELESSYNIECLCIKADLKNEEEINKLYEESINKFKKIDILINNAALDKPDLFENKNKSDFLEILDVNLVAPFLLSKLIGSDMLENKYGKIINIVSTNGIDTHFPMCLDYDASKAGLISLTHNLALEFKPFVNVNAIAPGTVNIKDMKELDKEYIESEKSKIYKERFCEVDEVAYLVEFLISDKADYINNQVIRIDGGMY